MSLEGTPKVEYVSLSGRINKFVIDKTLTISGACADAKATGDAIGELSNAIANQYSVYTKNQILADPTKISYGFDNNAVPDDVFVWLSKYNQHWWRRKPTDSDDWEYVQASDGDTYPDKTTEGGYYYEYLGVPFQNAVDMNAILSALMGDFEVALDEMDAVIGGET